MTVDLFGEESVTRAALGTNESAVGGTDEWLTPPAIVDALGPFDLDPCAPIKRPWPTAREHFTIEDNGLAQSWEGKRVWMNPPYAAAGAWMRRMAQEHGYGTALLFARTETATWQDWIWPFASAVLFPRGRLTFHLSDGRPAKSAASAPSALIAFGLEDALALSNSGIRGAFVPLTVEAHPWVT